MTKLEEDIYLSLLVQDGIEKVVDGNPVTAHNCEVHAKAAAEVAKRYISNAFNFGALHFIDNNGHEESAINKARTRWLKENGVTGEEEVNS